MKNFKFFKKYRKANLVKDYINSHSKSNIFDHWKSIENIDLKILKKLNLLFIHSKEINHSRLKLNKRMISALEKPDFVISNSNFTKNLLNKLGYEKNNIKIINPGCNYPIEVKPSSKEFAKTIFGNSFPKLLTISRLDGRKSHQNILMTIKNLLPKYPNLKYVSIGDGEEKEN